MTRTKNAQACAITVRIQPAVSTGWAAGLLGVLAAGMILAIGGCGKKPPQTLTVHVGGTMRPAMTELAKLYEQKTGRKIEINSADSGELLAYIESHREGDLYICHDPFMDRLMQRGLGADAWTVAALTPVIVVRKDAARKITGLGDLADPGVSVALTDFEMSTLGRLLPTIFRKAGVDLDKLSKRPNVQTFRSGGSAANAVELKNADAAIVWRAVAHLRRENLQTVPIPEQFLPTPGVDTTTSATNKTYVLTPVRVTIATLSCSKHADQAAAFAGFVASDEAAKVFQDFGFTMIPAAKEYQKGIRLPHGPQK